MRTRCLVLPAMLALSTLTAATQQLRSVEDLPADVRALVTLPGREGAPPPELLIGTLPQGFPQALVPPATRVQASRVTDAMTTVVAVADAFTAADRVRHVQRLAGVGWQAQGAPRSGFATNTATAVSFCRGNEFATVYLSDRKAGGALVRITLSTDPRRACIATPGLASAFPDFDVPALLPPDNAKVTATGAGGGSGRLSSTGRLDGPISAVAAAAHYRAQMEAAGWSLDSHASASDIITMRFGTTSRIGDPVTAILTIVAIKDSSELELDLKVFRNTPGRGRGEPEP